MPSKAEPLRRCCRQPLPSREATAAARHPVATVCCRRHFCLPGLSLFDWRLADMAGLLYSVVERLPSGPTTSKGSMNDYCCSGLFIDV